jgi:hypothetical protein
VAALLAATAAIQLRPLGPRGQLLNALALLPQWRFFSESRLRLRDDAHDDLHLVARDWLGGEAPGPWRPVLSPPERRWTQAIWNPSLRPDVMLASFADDLAAHPGEAQSERVTTSLAYLVLLRHCLDATPCEADAQARQFAIVRTRGRHGRQLSIAFVSLWHAW